MLLFINTLDFRLMKEGGFQEFAQECLNGIQFHTSLFTIYR